MKRSEMLDLMKHYWCQMSEELFLEQKIDFLLEQMEVNGMLPPRTKLKELNLEDNAWEPEDET